MPKLVCRSCGQGVYTTAPFEQLFADERRCPRCGQLLFSDRRSGVMRRRAQRRRPADAETASASLANDAPTNGAATNDPPTNDAPTNDAPTNGARPPEGAGSPTVDMPVAALVATETERRVADRRQGRRRRDDHNPFQRASEEAGWVG